MTYHVFTRSWWRVLPNGDREPEMGRKRTVRRGVPTVEEARALCASINDQRTSVLGKPVKPGKRGIKAEFERET